MDLSPLQKLARDVRAASDETATPSKTIDAARARALAGWKGRGRDARRKAAFVLAAAVLVGALMVVVLPRRPVITYVVGTNAEPGAIGAWIAAGADGMPVRFSEGTLLSLASNARARVTHADADGAAVLLERGSAHARVVHASSSTAWAVQAGPFEIAVVGTEFEVAWDPSHEVLELGMIEGKVVVKGPLCGEGRTLVRGEQLRVEVQAQRSEVRVVPPAEAEGPRAEVHSAEPAAVGSPSAPDEKPAEGENGAASEEGASREEKDKPTRPLSWRTLAAEGRHKEAMQAVEQEGFEEVLARASAPVLLELADEARFAGQYARSKAALLRARGLGARGRTAFLLGKLAADHESAAADAVTWFERYLGEAPQGGLAEQALGRIVELERRLGNTDKARAAAERYLGRHPEGAYASLARAALGP